MVHIARVATRCASNNAPVRLGGRPGEVRRKVQITGVCGAAGGHLGYLRQKKRDPQQGLLAACPEE